MTVAGAGEDAKSGGGAPPGDAKSGASGGGAPLGDAKSGASGGGAPEARSGGGKPTAHIGTLSRRIALATVALTGGAVGLAAVAVWMVAHWVLLDALDSRLHGRQARFMAERFAEHQGDHDHDRPPGAPGPQGPGPQGPPGPPPGGRPPGDLAPVYVLLRDRDSGRELWRSPSLSDQADVASALAGLTSGSDQPAWLALADRDLRFIAIDVAIPPPPAGAHADAPGASGPVSGASPSLSALGPGDAPAPKGLSVRVAVDGTATERELVHLAFLLAALWLTAVLLASLASWWLRRAILRPVHRLADAIRAVDPEHLPDRLPALAVPVEMAVVQERLDDLLARVRQVREREKGTIADIAHELRTPIAGLRTTLEFAAFEPGGSEIAARCLPTVLAMQALVANLLTMARIEAGHETVRVAAVDLARVVNDAWSALAPVAAGRGTTMTVTADGGAQARTCADHVRLVVANLLDNAVSHAPAGATVEVAIARAGDFQVVSIANATSAPPPDPANLFQPFWRGDAARSGGGLHCGLGLALCRRVMALLGGSIAADTGRVGWFRVEVRFPRV
jgi:signal transduction histidine kinase